MKRSFKYYKILIVIACLSITCLSFGAFTGKIDGQSDRFSLKNLHVNRPVFFSDIRLNSFSLTRSTQFGQLKGNQWQLNSMIRVENGNTTYVYPYKYKVKVPKFKTPTPPSNGLR